MVSKNYKIESFELSQEKRFEIIKEWVEKIKPMKTFSPFIGLAALAIGYLFGFLFAFIIVIAFVVYIYAIKKPETPKIIDESNPHFLKIELGVAKTTYPTTIEIKNDEDGIELDFSMFGAKLASKKIIKRWDFLNEQLEKMVRESSLSQT